jgi:nucleotide-binding universal stress UspA family protein
MMPFNRILFPVDLSDASEAMVGDVVAVARRFEASVTVLHAFNEVQEHSLGPRVDAPFGPEPGKVPYTAALKELRDVRQERLEEFVHKHLILAGVEAKAVVEDGDPGLAIEWAAKQEQAELVMISTKGMGTLRRMLGSSLPAKVLREMDCPVFTSPHSSGENPRSSDGFRTIVCAVGTDSDSQPALRIAAMVARAFGSRVCLLQTSGSEGEQEPEEAGHDLGEAFQNALGKDGDGTVASEVRVVDADAPESVKEAALEERADLVVVARGRSRSAVTHFWSNLYTVISESPCPVLSV